MLACKWSLLCSKDPFPQLHVPGPQGLVLGQLLLTQHSLPRVLRWAQDFKCLSSDSTVHIQSMLLNSSLVFLSPYQHLHSSPKRQTQSSKPNADHPFKHCSIPAFPAPVQPLPPPTSSVRTWGSSLTSHCLSHPTAHLSENPMASPEIC